MTIRIEKTQEAITKDVTIEELYNDYIPVSKVKLKYQRNRRNITQKQLENFNRNLIEGRIHQNITLVDVNECYRKTKDSRWLELDANYLILDGQHRITFVKITIDGNHLLVPEEKLYRRSKVPARIIKKMSYDDLGDTFVANNCGKPISDQDQLTFLDTDMSNFIVQFVEENWNVLGKIYSNENDIRNIDRKLDKEVRVTAQLVSNLTRYMFKYSAFPTGRDFYNEVKPSQVKQDLESWVKILDKIANNREKRTRAVAARMFISILKRYSYKIKNFSEFYIEFQKWESTEYLSEKPIKLIQSKTGNETRTYKELCTSHTDKELRTRLEYIESNFILPNIKKFTDQKVIINYNA